VVGRVLLLRQLYRGRRGLVDYCQGVCAESIYHSAADPLRRAIVSYVGWYSPQVLLFGISESDDYGRCQDLVVAVVQTNVVPQSVSRPGQPAVFCSNAEYGILRSRYQVLQIYSVPMDAQNVVLAAVSSTHQRLNGEGVQVVFYQRENWRIGAPYNADGTLADKDGTVVPGSATRGPEKIERVSVIR
jgi:hypothetical protein